MNDNHLRKSNNRRVLSSEEVLSMVSGGGMVAPAMKRQDYPSDDGHSGGYDSSSRDGKKQGSIGSSRSRSPSSAWLSNAWRSLRVRVGSTSGQAEPASACDL
jgi:hypothetical protein